MITNTHLSIAGVSLGDLSIDVAVQRIINSAAVLNAATKKAPPRGQDFGCQIVRAVQNRLVSRSRAPVIAENDESFSEKIKQAMERKRGGLPTQKQHKEQAERERARYSDPHRER